MQLTPTERLILLSLSQTPNQTAEQLQVTTGVKSVKPFRRSICTPVMARLIESDDVPRTDWVGGAR